MEADLQSSAQQLEAILSSPKDSYAFISTNGKNAQLLPCLIQLMVEPSYESNGPLRTQAAIIIRNALDSWYRKISPNQIDNQAKVQLGQTLVQKVLARGERDSAVRKQICLCVGKIGKSNLDSGLSNLFSDLSLHISNVLATPSWSNDPSNYYILNGCLGGFYQIIQNMITNRSSRGQLLLREVASSHFPHIQDVYSSALSTWTNLLSQTTLNLSSVFHSQPVIELSRICLKILGQMSIYAWKTPHKEELPTVFVKQCVTEWFNVLHIRKQLIGLISLHKTLLENQSSSKSIEAFFSIFNKHVYRYGKLLIEILNQDTGYLDLQDFSSFLKQTVWQIIDQGTTHLERVDESRLVCLALYPDKIIIQSLQIMSQVMISRPSSDTLTSSQATELAVMISKRLLVLQAHSLQFWAEDSEGYDNEETNLMDNAAFDVRSCAAKLLSGLLVTFPQEIITVIFGLHADMLSQGSNTSPAALLQYESIYFMIGLAASKLSTAPPSVFNLRDWIHNKFMPVLCQSDSSGRVIRRRIAWALGQFAKEDLDTETQSGIYVALNCLLENPNNDVATKLATCRSLKAAADWDASSPECDLFLPHLENYVKHISELLSEVENLESQKILTQTLCSVIEKAGAHIKPYAGQLVTVMAHLWQQVGESPSKNNSGNHLHNAILVTMSALTEALGPASQDYHQIIVSFIEHSINPNNPSSVYLQEDGFILWLTILRQTEVMAPCLRALLFSLGLIKDASDSLAMLLKILQSYLFLDAAAVLDSIGPMLSGIFAELMSMEMGLPPTKALLKSIECIVQCVDSERWQRWHEQSDCFFHLIQRSTVTDGSVVIAVKHILTICQLIVNDVESFLSLVGFLNRRGISPTEVLSGFCQACLDKIDYVTTAQERKLLASALACLVSNPNPIVIKHLEAFVSVWSSVLAEGDEILDTSTNTYRYAHEYDEVDEHDFVNQGLEEKRLKQLRARDPVKSRTLDAIISEQINRGGEQLLTGLGSIDSVLLGELKQRLSGSLKG